LGIIEDVLVKVGNFIFPIDFVVLEMEEEGNVPLILGWPFLATSRELVDVEGGNLILRVGNDEMVVKAAAVSHGNTVLHSSNLVYHGTSSKPKRCLVDDVLPPNIEQQSQPSAKSYCNLGFQHMDEKDN